MFILQLIINQQTTILDDKVDKMSKPGYNVAGRRHDKPCSNDVQIENGLNRGMLQATQSGVQMYYKPFTPKNAAWEPFFALLDADISDCGGCANTLEVRNDNSLLFFLPGHYKVSQITGLSDAPQNEDLCGSAPGYNVTVSTVGDLDPSPGSVSYPYGSLYEEGALVCSPEMFPNCPTDYKCCIWPRETANPTWEKCMFEEHGGADAYPHCQPLKKK
jgi:hypothetical protein